MDRRLMALAAAAATFACSSRPSRPEAGAAPRDSVAPHAQAPDTTDRRENRPRRRRADGNTITREELDEYGRASGTLYDYVLSYHFDWLRASGGGRIRQDARQVSVYVDGIRFASNPVALRQVSVSSVFLARRLGPSEAAAKYGLDNNAGIIEIFTSQDRVR